MSERMTVEQLADFRRGGKCKPLTLDDPEKNFQAWINNLFDSHGWLVYHDNDPRRNNAGFPDFVAANLHLGRFVVAELKKQRGGKVSPKQQEWLNAIRAASVECYLWRPEHMKEIERVATGGSGGSLVVIAKGEAK